MGHVRGGCARILYTENSNLINSSRNSIYIYSHERPIQHRGHSQKSQRSRSTVPVTLSVIFPAFNEEANIRHTVEAARLVLPKLAQTGKLFWSTMAAGMRRHPFAMSSPNNNPECGRFITWRIAVRGCAQKRHSRSALRLHFLHRLGWTVRFAGTRTPLEWASHYDIVTGYRAKRQDPPHRLINAWGWRTLVRMVLG